MSDSNTCVRPEIKTAVYALDTQEIKEKISALFCEGVQHLSDWFTNFMHENYNGFEVYCKRKRKNGKLIFSNGVITFEFDYKRKSTDGTPYSGRAYETVWDGRDWLLHDWYKESLSEVGKTIQNAFTERKNNEEHH